MKKHKFNILVTINTRYANYLQVMLTSLFMNNQANFCVYCLYADLNDGIMRQLREHVQKYGNEIVFLPVDSSLYQNFPTTENLTTECYFILLAHLMLPQELDRILYLDSDLIIDDEIDELYHTDFEDQYMVVCGQSYKLIEGNYFKIGARPERGEYFNSGVILFNLPKFRGNVNEETYLDAVAEFGYNFMIDQGILNIVFADKVKYIDTLKYNFRISMYEDYVKDGNKKLKEKPVIIHYVMRDYYKIGRVNKPWNLTMNEYEYYFLQFVGIIPQRYEFREADAMNIWMQNRWWYYAKQTGIYPILKEQLKQNKKQVLYPLMKRAIGEVNTYRKKINLFRNITKGIFPENVSDLKTIKYWELEKYIDSLEANKAVDTMKHLFDLNCSILKTEKVIKVAFLVYSSAEWQCEELYRMLEQDSRFEPVIILCGYAHGTPESKRETYVNTCAYFRDSERKYNLEYAGYCNRSYTNPVFNKFHIMVYFLPFDNLYPTEINCSNRNITQLFIHIPYGFYIVNKEDAYYKDSYYDQTIFKMCWFYFCPLKLNAKRGEYMGRLGGYNWKVSGHPKIDELLQHTYNSRSDLWKNEQKSKLKLIWAPHFNLSKGKNGTFHENYKWLYEFARTHQEISWIVRPHPRMEWGALEYGVFSSSAEYREYMMAWDNLPNASVVEGGGYYDIFDSSDAMILDSLSFLVEYQFTEKPLLFLLPKEPRRLNDLGEKLLSVLYKVRGNDFVGIERFIDDMVAGRDLLKNDRISFKNKMLQEVETEGYNATESIYKIISDQIDGKGERKYININSMTH
ncbi:MAG: glycosyltransferase family 8 protein [Lachnospiraceae bacterium]|nr:glycosyltransferase family 8 protein [Lachnospiraceae bacterium]